MPNFCCTASTTFCLNASRDCVFLADFFCRDDFCVCCRASFADGSELESGDRKRVGNDSSSCFFTQKEGKISHRIDVARLDEAGLAEAAFADRELANAVARHKSMFFAEKAADRTPIDYAAAVNGGLQLVPVGDGAKVLEEDYARMVEDGLLFDDAEPFEALMARCADIAARANRVDA